MSGIVGPGLDPGSEYERHSVVVDTRGAVLLDGIATCTIDDVPVRAVPTYAVQLSGRVNRSSARASATYLVDSAGLGGLIADLLAVAARSGDHGVVDVVLDRLQSLPSGEKRERS